MTDQIHELSNFKDYQHPSAVNHSCFSPCFSYPPSMPSMSSMPSMFPSSTGALGTADGAVVFVAWTTVRSCEVQPGLPRNWEGLLWHFGGFVADRTVRNVWLHISHNWVLLCGDIYFDVSSATHGLKDVLTCVLPECSHVIWRMFWHKAFYIFWHVVWQQDRHIPLFLSVRCIKILSAYGQEENLAHGLSYARTCSLRWGLVYILTLLLA